MSRERAIEPQSIQIGLRVLTALVLAFLYVPLFIIILYAFNPARSQSWPLPGLSTRWFVATWNNADVRTALLTSLKAGLGATTIALILGSLAAFAVTDGVRVWELKAPRGKEVGKLSATKSKATALAFSPDGRRLLTGHADGTVRLWDVGSRRELRAFQGHTGEVKSVVFAGDGRFAASGGADQTVRWWKLPL